MATYIVDTETTGVGKNDQVIQFAWYKISDNVREVMDFSGDFSTLTQSNEYFNPSVSIHPKAQEVHGLSKIKLLTKPQATTVRIPSDLTTLIAHNAPFDVRMLSRTDPRVSEVNVICTQSLTKRIEKIRQAKFDTENYQLTTLYKFFYPEENPKHNNNLHDAVKDCQMLLLVLVKLLENFPFLHTFDALYDYLKTK